MQQLTKVYDANKSLPPVTITGKERDVIVNAMRNAEIVRFGDAVIVDYICEILNGLDV